MNNNNFLWLIDDINDSFRIKLFYHDKDGNKRYATYIGKDINRLDNSKIELEDGNIEGLDSVIGGMVRFVNNLSTALAPYSIITSANIILPSPRIFLIYLNPTIL